MSSIDTGDIVAIEWFFGDVVGHQIVKAEVLHVPGDVGDHWYMKNIIDQTVFTVNPNCAWLVSVGLEEKYDE